MIVSKVQKQSKLNKVVVVAPQASPAKFATAPQVSASQDRIRERAFEIFEKRGSKPGHDLQDWFRAERQVLAQ
jgi:ABC-type tungstate transport system permease subunit